jgi:hypothetical protein
MTPSVISWYDALSIKDTIKREATKGLPIAPVAVNAHCRPDSSRRACAANARLWGHLLECFAKFLVNSFTTSIRTARYNRSLSVGTAYGRMKHHVDTNLCMRKALACQYAAMAATNLKTRSTYLRLAQLWRDMADSRAGKVAPPAARTERATPSAVVINFPSKVARKF